MSLLVSLRLATTKSYGHNKYYLSEKHQPWVSWGYREGSLVRDAYRWQAILEDHYRKMEPRKAKALDSYIAAKRG